MKADKETRLIDMSIGAMVTAFAIAICAFLLVGCSSTYACKVTFANGESEFYNLEYRPKPTDKYIKVEGETIIGVKNIERVQ